MLLSRQRCVSVSPGQPYAHGTSNDWFPERVCLIILGRVSFTNNARIYNLEHRDVIEQFPDDYNSVHGPELTPTLLSDIFFLFALLRDRAEHDLCLVHDSRGDQSDRLDSLLEDRTLAWVGPGRENWNHVCDKCRVQKVIDGQTCAYFFFDCISPLRS